MQRKLFLEACMFFGEESVKETNIGGKEYFYHCNVFCAPAQNQTQAF